MSPFYGRGPPQLKRVQSSNVFVLKAGKFLKGQKYAGKLIEEGVEFEVPMCTDLASDKL